MSAYCDSAVLVKIYCLEADSPKAIALFRQYKPPLPLTHLQELEMRNAWRLKLFRKEITQQILAQAIVDVEQDIANGLFVQPAYHVSEVYRLAENLSASHSPAFGCRSLDVLQVATALTIRATDFISFDDRQRKLAKAAGLKIKP